jgi:polysaccharide pyruvyl transferase WcaK-like protein
MRNTKRYDQKIRLFGNFGVANFGNECTLQAMLYHVRRLMPNADISCICSMPEIVAANYQIAALPICDDFVKPWNLRKPIAKWARKLFIGIPCELYRWLKGVITLYDTDMLIVVGTGLVTDAFGIGGWGPYSIFKWSVIARLCGCRLAFVSIGAGPLDSRRGRLFVKSALWLANFRSYRDESSLEYLESIGFQRSGDRVYPDLAFSLPLPSRKRRRPEGYRPVVGLGLMSYAAMYGVEKTNETHYAAYIETLVVFLEWLLKREYQVRLLIGDLSDIVTVREFETLLRMRLANYDEVPVIAEPIVSTEDLLSQLDATDFIVATRFHNVLLGLFLNKPSIAISFHHKCSSLMKQLGLSEYYQDIKLLNADRLIEQFCDLENNEERLRVQIRSKTDECRAVLDEQYLLILNSLSQ